MIPGMTQPSRVEVTTTGIMEVQVRVSGWLIQMNLNIIQNYNNNWGREENAGLITVI